MNYSLSNVSGMYEEYFQMLLNLRGEGFYTSHPARPQMNWLRKSYPVAATEEFQIGPHSAPVIVECVGGLAQRYERDWWGTQPQPHWEEESRETGNLRTTNGLAGGSEHGHENDPRCRLRTSVDVVAYDTRRCCRS